MGCKGKGGKKKGKGKGKGKGTGAKAAPKYRDPVTGSTWTGRGVAPLWIRDVAKEDRARFLIGDAPAVPAATAEAPAPVGQPVEDEPVEVMDTEPTEPTAPLFGASAE